MTTYERLLRLMNVVKTIVVIAFTAIGPSPEKASRDFVQYVWYNPEQQESGKDYESEAAKGLLRLRYEQLPESALKKKEESPNGVPYEERRTLTL